jgi:hypothetical protein
MAAPSWSDPLTPDGTKEHRNVVHAGGTPGWVCANRWTTSYVGPDVTSFEWNHVCIIANEAKAGENVAHYAQANSRNTGPTWAAVSEVCDESFGARKATLVAHEFDVWCAGNDDKPRVGIHVVVNDSRRMRGRSDAGVAVGTDAIRISDYRAAGSRWRVGINFDSAPDHLLEVQDESIIREPLGKYIGKMPVKVGGRTVYIPVYE